MYQPPRYPIGLDHPLVVRARYRVQGLIDDSERVRTASHARSARRSEHKALPAPLQWPRARLARRSRNLPAEVSPATPGEMAPAGVGRH